MYAHTIQTPQDDTNPGQSGTTQNEQGKVSHATGDSKVPQKVQEGLPEKVEKAVPNAVHDTSGTKFSDGSVSK